MLRAFFGYDKDAIRDIDTWFNHVYEAEWFDDERVRQIVKDIDKSEVVGRDVVISPVFGSMSVRKISGGAKALIAMLMMDDTLIDLIVCGPNCQEWISRIAAEKDVEVAMSGYDLTFAGLPVSDICLNDGKTFSNSDEWIDNLIHYVDEGER